jgi:hypothetical protein
MSALVPTADIDRYFVDVGSGPILLKKSEV